MGCCCTKSTDVKESIVAINNVLDSPFTRQFQRERDGTLKQGQIPNEILNAYADVLEDDEFFDINESFKENPLQINPFTKTWIETKVPDSEFLVNASTYTPPLLEDPQPEYLLDMSQTLSVYNIPTNEPTHFQGKLYSSNARAIFLPPNKVLVCGGRGCNKTYLVDIHSNSVTKQGNLKESREYHALSLIDDFVVASGGMAYEELSSCEIWFRGQWSVTGSMMNSRSFHSSATIDRCIYVIGGIRQVSIEKWNGGEWALVPVRLPFPLGRSGICPINSHAFLVTGGESNGQYNLETWEINFYQRTVKALCPVPDIAVFDSAGSLTQKKANFYLAGKVLVYNVINNNWITY